MGTLCGKGDMGPSGSRFQHTGAWPSVPGEEHSVALSTAHLSVIHVFNVFLCVAADLE